MNVDIALECIRLAGGELLRNGYRAIKKKHLIIVQKEFQNCPECSNWK